MRDPDKVSVVLGRTLSANYNSVRAEVGLTTSCEENETAEQAYARAAKFCRRRIDKLVADEEKKLY